MFTKRETDIPEFGGKCPTCGHTCRTSSANQQLVEALKDARKTLTVASRILSEEHRVILRGKKWGGSTLELIDEALAAHEKEGKG